MGRLFPPPQFGVPLTTEQMENELPFNPIYGVTPDNKYIPINVDQQGRIVIGAEMGPITIGDVNVKGLDPDAAFSSQNVSVLNLGGNAYSLRTSLYDGSNRLKVNADGSINVTGEVVITPVEEQHTVDTPLDVYLPGVSKGNLPTMRVVSAPPVLTAGQFSSPTLTPAGRLIVDPTQTNVSKETGGNLDAINAGLQTLNSLVPSKYDYIDLQYSGANLTRARFYLGGPSGTLVSTLILMYSGANLSSVQRS